MASQSTTSINEPMHAARLAQWRAYHVFYHADLNQLVRGSVQPLANELFSSGLIDRLYFVRYALGGPHVRIRLRLTTGQTTEAVERTLARRTAEFFAAHPSREPQTPDRILATNEGIAKGDAFARNEVHQVYQDNSWQEFPPQIEVARYGGEEHIEASLDFFCLSTISVFDLFQRHDSEHRVWATSAMMRLALQLALGFSGSEGEFLRLLGYALEPWGRQFPSCVEAADRAFESRQRALTEFMVSELEAIATAKLEHSTLFAGARVLAKQVSSLSAENRWRIFSSHIHMTANRLGILNPEEAYVSRMLVRAAEDVRMQYPAACKLLCRFTDRLHSVERAGAIKAMCSAAMH